MEGVTEDGKKGRNKPTKAGGIGGTKKSRRVAVLHAPATTWGRALVAGTRGRARHRQPTEYGTRCVVLQD